MESLDILLVEDEEELLGTMSTILELRNCRVAKARGGAEALSLVDERASRGSMFDMLITDVSMPGITGTQLIEMLENRGARIPTIVISGYGTKSLVVDLMRRGVSDFIDKPFLLAEFLDRVDKVGAEILAKRGLELSAACRSAALASASDPDSHGMLGDQLWALQKFQLLREMAGGIVHNFRNMMGAVVGYADLILNDPSDAQACAKRILTAAGYGLETLEQFLAMAREVTAGKTPVNVNDIIRESGDLVAPRFGDGVTVRLDLTPDRAMVLGDAGQIRHAIINLMQNACEAMPEGGTLTVATSVLRDLARKPGLDNGAMLLVKVADTGTGMSDKVKNRLYEPFFTTKGVAGTGLGLVSVLQTMSRHNGGVELDSTPGKGTEFRLLFPLVSDAETNMASGVNSRPHGGA